MSVRRGPSDDEHGALVHAIRRHLVPVASRAGWVDEPASTTFCGSAEDLAAAQPWLVEQGVLDDEDLDPHGECVDLHLYRQEGWVGLTAEHVVRWSLWAPAGDVDELDAAIADLAAQLADGLDRQVVIEGTRRPPGVDTTDGGWRDLG